MTKSIITILLSILLFANTQAQSLTVARKKVFSSSLSSKPITESPFFTPIYFKLSATDEKYERIGFLGNKLKPILANNELAILEFKRFQRDKILGFSCLGVGLAAYGVVVYDLSKRLYGESNQVENFNKDTYLSLAGSSILFMVASGVLRQSANRHLQNSVYLYNKSKMPALQDVGFNIAPNPNGGMFYGANLRFSISE